MNMLSKNDIKKLAKKIVRQQQGKRSQEIMHPARDWFLGVLIALILVFVSAAWSAAKYIETKETISAGVMAEAEDAVVYRESNINEALSIATNRQQTASAYQPESVEIPEDDISTSTATSSDSVATSTSNTPTTTTDQSVEMSSEEDETVILEGELDFE